MKNSLFLVGALVVGAVSAHVSMAAPSPGPKRPGPSAVQAARLKKSPPANYLAHYLPDDRYKIAGGVWKYVSTDLDTYYHIPTSPNMLRQPANRVIGFANARDAEEAGYVADPTDGTASRAAAALAPPPSRERQGGAGLGVEGRNALETAYLKQMTPLLIEGLGNMRTLGARLQQTSGSRDVANTFAVSRDLTRTYLRQSSNLLSRFNRLKPPSRMRRGHLATRAFLIEMQNSVVYLNRMSRTGDTGNLTPFMERIMRAQAAAQRAQREFRALR